MRGSRIAFVSSVVTCLVAAAASWPRGGPYAHEDAGEIADTEPPEARVA